MLEQQLTTTFDYSQLDEATRNLCHDTAKIATSFLFHARHTIDRGFELGEHLIQVKEHLPHGQYMPYIASIGIPYQVAAYWTRAVKTQRQLDASQIFDIKYLEEPQPDISDSQNIPEKDADQQDVQDILGDYDLEMSEADTTEHDMQQHADAIHLSIFHQLAPERQQQITQVMMEVAQADEQGTVEGTIQVLKDGETSAAPKGNGHHHGGGHHGPITKKVDGGTIGLDLGTKQWRGVEVEWEAGWRLENLKMGVYDGGGNPTQMYLSIQNTTGSRKGHVFMSKSDIDTLDSMLEDLQKQLRKLRQ